MNRTTFEVGTFEVNCSILSENGKAIVVDAGGQLALLAKSFEDAHFAVAGAGEHHVETVRAQIQGGDHGEGLSGGLAHWAVSMQNPDILT